jgi:hypothetical protein
MKPDVSRLIRGAILIFLYCRTIRLLDTVLLPRFDDLFHLVKIHGQGKGRIETVRIAIGAA